MCSTPGKVQFPPLLSPVHPAWKKRKKENQIKTHTHTYKILTKRNICDFLSSGPILPKEQEGKKTQTRAQSQPEMDSVCENMECIEPQAQKPSQLPPPRRSLLEHPSGEHSVPLNHSWAEIFHKYLIAYKKIKLCVVVCQAAEQ